MPLLIGTRVELRCTFVDAKGQLKDPTEVTAYVRNPKRTLSTLKLSLGGVVRESQGVYVVAVTLDQAGTWGVRFEGTGALVAAGENALIEVEASRVI